MNLSWKAMRRITLALVCLFFLIVGHAAGLIIDFVILFVYFGTLAGMKIYKKGTKYIARTNAQAIVDEQERRRKTDI
jgi:hypothetical protein